jgi:serine/threonine protein kinase
MQELEIEKINQYRIQRLLARGGMAKVYLAQHTRTGKQVAMKLVHSSATEYSARFRCETETLAKLSHKHILPVIEYGEYELWHYLVTPYIPGGTLNHRLKKGPLSCKHAGELLDQLAQALQFAHQQGLVHRDIKASNVLMRDEHFIYLAVFGLAKPIDEPGDFALSGYILATPEYMAPELAVDKATPVSDLYSLGILLYQMITGKLPFIGNNAINICLQHIREFPPLPSSFNANIPEAVESVILRALEKDPLKRFQTVRELSQAYWQALQEDWYNQMKAITQIIPVLEAPQVSVHKIRQSRRRSRLAITILGLIVLGSIPIILGLPALSHGPSPLPAHTQLGSLPPHINVNVVISTPTPLPTPTPTSAPVISTVTTEAPQSPTNLQNNTPQPSPGGSEPANNNADSGDVSDRLNDIRQIIQNIAEWQRQAQSANNNEDVSDRLNDVRQIIQNIPGRQRRDQSPNDNLG